MGAVCSEAGLMVHGGEIMGEMGWLASGVWELEGVMFVAGDMGYG